MHINDLPRPFGDTSVQPTEYDPLGERAPTRYEGQTEKALIELTDSIVGIERLISELADRLKPARIQLMRERVENPGAPKEVVPMMSPLTSRLRVMTDLSNGKKAALRRLIDELTF